MWHPFVSIFTGTPPSCPRPSTLGHGNSQVPSLLFSSVSPVTRVTLAPGKHLLTNYRGKKKGRGKGRKEESFLFTFPLTHSPFIFFNAWSIVQPESPPWLCPCFVTPPYLAHSSPHFTLPQLALFNTWHCLGWSPPWSPCFAIFSRMLFNDGLLSLEWPLKYYWVKQAFSDPSPTVLCNSYLSASFCWTSSFYDYGFMDLSTYFLACVPPFPTPTPYEPQGGQAPRRSHSPLYTQHPGQCLVHIKFSTPKS